VFIFNELLNEFQVKKLYLPRKFTCPLGRPGEAKGTDSIDPLAGEISRISCSLLDIPAIRAASAAPPTAFRLPGATASTFWYATRASFGWCISMSRSPSSSQQQAKDTQQFDCAFACFSHVRTPDDFSFTVDGSALGPEGQSGSGSLH
jgi:hypothetical protein